MIRGVAGQIVSAQITDRTTGQPYVGAVSVLVDGDNTGQVAGSSAAAAKGNGEFSFLPTAAETSFAHVAYTFVPAGTGINVTIQIDTISPAQVQALQSATGLASVVVSDLIAEALTDIRAIRAGDTMAPELQAFALAKLNRLLDRWNADPRAAFNAGFASYTLTPNHQPHTIGPSGADFTVIGRPTRIQGANLILTTVTPAVRLPIRIRDAAWWLANTVQGLATPIATDLYYDPDWPNGKLNLWPVPTAAYQIELLAAELFGALLATDTFWMPFGYRDAVALTLAEACAPGCGQTASQDLKNDANAARALIFGNNDEPPYLRTRDSGLRSGNGGGGFNWLNRSTR